MTWGSSPDLFPRSPSLFLYHTIHDSSDIFLSYFYPRQLQASYSNSRHSRSSYTEIIMSLRLVSRNVTARVPIVFTRAASSGVADKSKLSPLYRSHSTALP